MSNYTTAENYVTGLMSNFEGNVTLPEIKSFNSGYLAGVQENSLPHPRLINCVLSDNNVKDKSLLNLLASEGIISR